MIRKAGVDLTPGLFERSHEQVISCIILDFLLNIVALVVGSTKMGIFDKENAIVVALSTLDFEANAEVTGYAEFELEKLEDFKHLQLFLDMVEICKKPS
jgi:hypothetical protein